MAKNLTKEERENLAVVMELNSTEELYREVERLILEDRKSYEKEIYKKSENYRIARDASTFWHSLMLIPILVVGVVVYFQTINIIQGKQEATACARVGQRAVQLPLVMLVVQGKREG